MPKILRGFAAGVAMTALGTGQVAAAKSAIIDAAPAATIPGVTLQAVRLGKPPANGRPPPAQTVFADTKGKALYTFDKDAPGTSTCLGECAAIWSPFLAPANAKPAPDWSVIIRNDGARQWAHEGRPLYTYAEDKALGPADGHNIDGVWHAAVLQAPAGLLVPTEIAVVEVPTAPGLAFVDARGMSLYRFDRDAGGIVSNEWQPVRASALARTVGDFTVVKRRDGIAQWAHKGQPLYTFSGDVDRGDANGKSVDRRFHIALVRSYFMPADIVIRPNQKRGGILATRDDQTLYARERPEYTGNSTHNARGGARGTPQVGLAVGLSGCDAACEQVWLPLKAPADAEPSGYWTVFMRADGSKQWGYQGYALYSFAQDPPGEVTGHDRYDYAINHSIEDANVNTNSALGLYWRVTSP